MTTGGRTAITMSIHVTRHWNTRLRCADDRVDPSQSAAHYPISMFLASTLVPFTCYSFNPRAVRTRPELAPLRIKVNAIELLHNRLPVLIPKSGFSATWSGGSHGGQSTVNSQSRPGDEV
jgi:hypothetical protein